jgi:hypothetical protein
MSSFSVSGNSVGELVHPGLPIKVTLASVGFLLIRALPFADNF